MSHISKKSIAGIVVIILLIVGSWFWYALEKENLMHQKQEIPLLSGEDADNYSMIKTSGVSSWDTYHSDKYGIEFKHPKDFVVVEQPGSNIAIGSVFVVRKDVYDSVKEKNAELLKTNPLLAFIDESSFSIVWNRSSWIADNFRIGDYESVLKDFLLRNERHKVRGMEYETSLDSFRLLDGLDDGGKIYGYVLRYEGVEASGFSNRKGFIRGLSKSLILEVVLSDSHEFDVELENIAVQSISTTVSL